MSLRSVIAYLEEEHRQTSAQSAGRLAFEQFGERAIRHGELTAEETEAALQRLRELARALPVILTTPEDREEATRICRMAADRLTAAPCYGEVIRSWPAPIAHEIQALVACLSGAGRAQPSPEAALLQLRDLAETLVKLPASILARRVIALGGSGGDVMRRALREVRGGAWNGLGSRAAELLRVAEPDGALAGVAALFEPGSPYRMLVERLASARNDHIGHGAMRTNPAETARIVAWFAAGQRGDAVPTGPSGPIPAGQTILTGLADAAARTPWAGLALAAMDDDGPIALTGAAALQDWHADPRHSAHAGRTLPVRLAIQGEAPLLLSPLVHARICNDCSRRDVFFFDNIYDDRPWKVDFLDYGRGHKSRLRDKEAADLLAELGPQLPRPGPPAAGSLDSRSAIATLDAMRVDHRYRSPTYLRAPFAAFLAGQDRGIYWLQAPAHVGKTMFAQGLSDVTLHDERIALDLGPGAAVAAFFCKREYREGRLTYLNALSSTLKRVLDIPDSHVFPAPAEVISASDPRSAFVAWLDRWRALAKPPGRRLLVIIDGLDETDAPGRDSLLGLLPAMGELSAGLYLLLISRPIGDADCPAWLGGALAPLGAMVRRFGLGDAGYQALMQGYARDRLGFGGKDPAQAAEIDALIARAEGRFVFLSFLVEQRRLGLPEQEGAGDAL